MVGDRFSAFRSEAARAGYLADYDRRARRWPVPSRSLLVTTSFGETFVRASGPRDGAPLVLLPGDSESSLAWIPVVKALSVSHRTYAVDHVYDVGRSICRRRPRSRADFVQWLDELFDALELGGIDLVGHSYGGWQASLYALAHPERLAGLVLLAPAATVLRPRAGVVWRAVLYHFVPLRPVVTRYLYWYAPDAVRRDATREAVDEMVDEALLARRCYGRRRFVPPTVLTDAEWKGLRVPTLFLVGEDEVTYSAERAVRRLARVAPQVRTSIARHADHHLALVGPEWVSRTVLEFLEDC